MFPVGTQAGMRVQSTCYVQEGDLPIVIQWKKDNANLMESSSAVKITQVINRQQLFYDSGKHFLNEDSHSIDNDCDYCMRLPTTVSTV